MQMWLGWALHISLNLHINRFVIPNTRKSASLKDIGYLGMVGRAQILEPGRFTLDS